MGRQQESGDGDFADALISAGGRMQQDENCPVYDINNAVAEYKEAVSVGLEARSTQ